MARQMLGGCAAVKEKARNGKRRAVRASAGLDVVRFGLALPRWAGRRRRTAISSSTRQLCPGDGQPLSQRCSSFSYARLSLTARLHGAGSSKPWRINANDLNKSCSSMYQLHLFLKDQVLIRNKNWVISSQRSAVSTVRVQDLAELAKCWKLLTWWFLWAPKE